MTICIGAICRDPVDQAPAIVLCCDTRLTYQATEFAAAIDLGFKLGVAGNGVVAMMAGDLTKAQELVAAYREDLGSLLFHGSHVGTQIEIPVMRYRERLMDRHVRRKYGQLSEHFFDNVYPKLSAERQNGIDNEISAISLDCLLILSVYADGHPYLFTVNPDGTVVECKDFTVIGCAYTVSQSILFNRKYCNEFSLGAALYAVYEAKRFAEIDPSVGPETIIGIHHPPNKSRNVLWLDVSPVLRPNRSTI